MAKYDITYSCGHTGEAQLYGKYADREYQIKRLSQRLCPECYAAEQAKLNAAAAAESAESGMPALTGSEKQIAWATSIRLGFAKKLDEYITQRTSNLALVAYRAKAIAAGHDPEAAVKKLMDGAQGVREAFRWGTDTLTDASWWIDRRNRDIEYLVYDINVAKRDAK